jgi:hypothetical protein
MTDTYLGAIVSSELFQQYQNLSRKKGQSLEDLVKAALSQYLEGEDQTDILSIQTLNEEILTLKDRVKELESTQLQVNRLSLKLQVLEHKFEQLSSHNKENIPSFSPPTIESMVSSNQEDYEADEYDEPDEVLWDFIPDQIT